MGFGRIPGLVAGTHVVAVVCVDRVTGRIGAAQTTFTIGPRPITCRLKKSGGIKEFEGVFYAEENKKNAEADHGVRGEKSTKKISRTEIKPACLMANRLESQEVQCASRESRF